MIKIQNKRRGTCPPILDRVGQNKIMLETNENNRLYDANPTGYDDRTVKWDIKSEIYGHSDIKIVLRKSQFGKCAFCESNVAAIAHGDIEHYRPKKYWIQNVRTGEKGPGYYWLAYDFNNLLFSCQICNQRYKKNHFPIRRPEFRCLNHHHSANLVKEKPFYINPLLENPKFLLKFLGAEAKGIDKNHRGKKTIDSLGLNRKGEDGISDLYEMRLTHFDVTKNTYWMANQLSSSTLPQNMIDEAIQLMELLRDRKSQYSAMVNDNFPA